MIKEASVALLDGDLFIYRAGFSADSQVLSELRNEVAAEYPDWSEQEVKDNAYLRLQDVDYINFALGNTRTAIEAVIENRESFRLFLTGKGNFRETIATMQPYKGNRDPTHKPKYYSEIKQYMIDRWKGELIEGMEADDAIGIAQWAARDKSTIICSIDKDLKMIPGWHYNLKSKETEWVDLANANKMFFWQMLVGDSTDNIPGINKMGPVKSSRLLDPLTGDEAAMKEAVWDYYVKQYGDNAHNAWNEVAQLLFIKRESDGDCPWLV